MTKKLELLIEGVNLSEDYRYLEPSNIKRLEEIYISFYGNEKLEKIRKSQEIGIPHLLCWKGNLEIEIRETKLNVYERKDIIDKIEPYYCKNWMLVDLIQKSLEEDNILFAKTIISELPDKDSGPSQFVGQRKLLNYYAEINNIEEFRKILKLSKPSKSPMSEIHMYKDLMIENYSKKNGYEKGIILCKEKIFGQKYCLATIRWKVHKIELSEIEKILNQNELFFKSEEFAKEKLFANHFYFKKPTVISELEFRKVVDTFMLIDKDIKWGDGRLRDGLLSELGSSILDLKQINECKKNIISPFYKREMNYHLKNIKTD